MRILVYPGHMEIGGSQLNALELAHGTAARGHEVVLFGPGGVLVPVALDRGLEFIHAPREHRWPTSANMARLCDVVRDRGIDVVHGYEWGPCLDLAFGPHARLGTPAVNTVLSMEVPAFLPRHVPLIVGTRELAEEQRGRPSVVRLIEPPVDLDLNQPDADRDAPRRRLGLAPGDVVITVVCRLTDELGKVDGLLEAVDVIGRLGAAHPVRLLVVGDGPGLERVHARAAAVNAELGREAVRARGGMLDPRDAYDAADIVLGMGSSALRAMAYATPLVVQGPNGFWTLLDESSAPGFAQTGWCGHGDGNGRTVLASVLGDLLAAPERWPALGALGRRIVESRYSLDAAVETLVDVYEHAVASPAPNWTARRSLGAAAAKVARWKVSSRLDRSPSRLPRDVAAPQAAAA